MSTLSTAIDYASNDTAFLLLRHGSDNTAVCVTFAQLRRDIESFQRQLARLGIGHGSVITTALPNSYEFVVAFLAASFQRASVAPINPVDTQSAFEFRINDLKSPLLLVLRSDYEKKSIPVQAAAACNTAVAECYYTGTSVNFAVKGSKTLPVKQPQALLKPKSDDVALILYTSGTTGLPKAVPLSHLNLTVTMRNITDSLDLSPQDRTVLVMPLFHAHGLLGGMLSPLFAGGSVVLPYGGFRARHFWSDAVDHEVNWYTAVPTIHQIVLGTPIPANIKKRPKFKFIRSCSSPLTMKVFQDLERTFDTIVIEAYAITEGTSQVTSNLVPSLGQRKPGSVGLGIGVEVRIIDEAGQEVPVERDGEIAIRGKNVTSGYRSNDEANKKSFTAEKFFRTGDRGRKDADGFLYITGRTKEMINKGGEKISPLEIDNILVKDEQVAEGVAFSIPDDHFGENVGATVVLKNQQQGSGANEESLKARIKNAVPAFKVPKRIWIVDSIPKTSTGKIQRGEIAKQVINLDTSRASKL